MTQEPNANNVAGTRDQILIYALNDTIFAQKQLIAKLNEEIERLKGSSITQIAVPFTPGSPINIPNFTPWVSPPLSPCSPFIPPGITITCESGTAKVETQQHNAFDNMKLS